MSDADNFSTEQAINPYYTDDTINLEVAKSEHTAIKTAFESAGIKVDQVESPINCQDGVYAANWALVRGNKAVLARLPNARKAEESYAKAALEARGIEVHEVPGTYHFSGQGDALPCGELLFCGSTYRSDAEAQEFAAKTLGYNRIQLRAAPELDEDGREMINKASGWADSFFYDIDLALAIIKPPTDSHKGLIAYCPEAFVPESRKILENLEAVDKIIVNYEEATKGFACNLVSTGETVIMSAEAPQLRQDIEAHGLSVITPTVKELAKGGGYIRCVSLSFND